MEEAARRLVVQNYPRKLSERQGLQWFNVK